MSALGQQQTYDVKVPPDMLKLAEHIVETKAASSKSLVPGVSSKVY